jgi:alpha-beta hydrolase superfamily lysophospholipase
VRRGWALSVGQKAGLIAAGFLLAVAAAIGLTALLTSLWLALAVWLGAVLLLAALALLRPLRADRLAAVPAPAADYDAAAERFRLHGMSGSQPLNPLCHPELLTHGRRTARVVVLLHGVSSCPRAFVDFAPLLFAQGDNVVALRMPENGYADRATDALGRLTAEKLKGWGDIAVDIAAGLGDEVVVLGISAGGVVAAWCGQNRPEVARVVLVAPMFGLANLGPVLNAAIMRITLLLPDFSIWKDPVLRARLNGLPHCYLRQSSRATGEILRLAHAVMRQAETARAATLAAAVVTNANDSAVDNGLTDRFADAWARHGVRVDRFRFDASHRLGHELVDPLEPGADPALTYPVLLRLIAGQGASEGQ